MDASEQSRSPPRVVGRKPAKSVADILAILRVIAEQGTSGNIVDLNSHRLAAEEIKDDYRSLKSTAMGSRIVAAVSCTCATAAVISMLQILTTYFE